MVLKINFIDLIILLTCLIVFVNAEYNCDSKKDGFYSDEDFCHIYWRCNYGVAEEYECPAGTAWNHIESRCDWLDNVDCSRAEEPKKEEEEPEEETTKKPKKGKQKAKAEPVETTPPVEHEEQSEKSVKKLKSLSKKKLSRNVVTNAPAAEQPKLEASNNKTDSSENEFDYDDLCINVTTTAGFRDDPFICNRYIRCNHGFAQKFVCSKHTAWDIEKRMCLWTSEIDCGDRQLVTDEKLLGENDTDEKMKRNGTRTTKSTTRTTMEITTLISTTKSNLNSDSNKPTNSPASNAPLCQSFGSYYVQDNSNCASYFMCNNGKETKMNCTEKQLFNAETSQCEDYQLVFCGSRPVNMAERNLCASKRDGIYPDIDRLCRVFFQCVNQQKTREATCPNQLKFNSLSGKCDNPANIMSPCGTYSTSGSFKLNLNYLNTLFTILYSVKKFILI